MKDHAGRTPLHHAVFMESNQVLMISKLLDYGADVNALDTDRRTCLHHAAEANKARVIPILIQRGALTGLKDSLMNKTPLELAANDHIKEIIIAYCAP
jgi:ankyrin repeat protein